MFSQGVLEAECLRMEKISTVSMIYVIYSASIICRAELWQVLISIFFFAPVELLHLIPAENLAPCVK